VLGDAPPTHDPLARHGSGAARGIYPCSVEGWPRLGSYLTHYPRLLVAMAGVGVGHLLARRRLESGRRALLRRLHADHVEHRGPGPHANQCGNQDLHRLLRADPHRDFGRGSAPNRRRLRGGALRSHSHQTTRGARRKIRQRPSRRNNRVEGRHRVESRRPLYSALAIESQSLESASWAWPDGSESTALLQELAALDSACLTSSLPLLRACLAVEPTLVQALSRAVPAVPPSCWA
jgi:hypothetical protein